MPTFAAPQAHDSGPRAAAPDLANLAEQLALLREELDAVQRRLTAISEQQEGIRAALDNYLHGALAARQGEELLAPAPAADAQTVLIECAQDIVRVLHEVGHPLTTLEILEQLVRRHASWRENTVRHALTELLDKGVLTVTGDGGPYSYRLRTGPEALEPSRPLPSR